MTDDERDERDERDASDELDASDGAEPSTPADRQTESPAEQQLGAAPASASASAPAPPEDADRRATAATARRAAVAGLRLATGVVGVVGAVAVVATVGLLPLPDVGPVVPAQRVVPVATDLSRLCPGSLLRLGDGGGADATAATATGSPQLTVDAADTAERRSPLRGSATDAQVLAADPGRDAAIAGAQSQSIADPDLLGLAAASCREPSGSSWLVGGATTTGRTTFVTLSNPTEVGATVELRLWGEQGPVDAPGLSGIVVDAGSQRVVSLSGYAQDLASPVVQVISRGGRVVATLQSSVIRTLDPGGVELTGESSAPSTDQVIPGLRIIDPQNVGALLGDEDYADARPVLRLLSPTARTQAQIVLRRVGGGDAQTSSVPLQAGTVLDLPLDQLAAGTYSIEVLADQPVVASARASTARKLTGAQFEAPVNDLAWFAAGDPIEGDTAFTVPDGPSPQLALVNTGRSARTVTLHPLGGGADSTISVPADGSAAVGVADDRGYRLSGADGLIASVSLGGAGQLASYLVASPRAVSGPITIRR